MPGMRISSRVEVNSILMKNQAKQNYNVQSETKNKMHFSKPAPK